MLYKSLFIVGFQILICLKLSVGVKGGRPLTPLLVNNKTACIAENLRKTNKYVCDHLGNIICIKGWSRPDLLCETPLCKFGKNSCVHGKCIYPNVCGCEVGWDGLLCDTCIPLGGCQHGTCKKPMECICDHGYSGPFCKEVECKDCVNGLCYKPNKCICKPGWMGPKCDQCMTLPSCQHGTCKNQPFECICNNGYKGFACHKPICRYGCHPVHGTCSKPGECNCKIGFKGSSCNICIPHPGCKGTCVNNIPWTCSTNITIPTTTKPTTTKSGSAVGHWSQWSSCSQTCGTGYQLRYRACFQAGSKDCNNLSGKRRCYLKDCSKDGNWGSWLQWTSCSATCGQGRRWRRRQCDSPPPSQGGRYCVGDTWMSESCKSKECPKDGAWKNWSQWSSCSVSCGDGVQHRKRDCIDPTHGGKHCQGSSKEYKDCKMNQCPVHGAWKNWSLWSSCSVSCGNGVKHRERDCTDPRHGGKHCQGPSKEYKDCIMKQCPIDGAWKNWSPWSGCSVSCGDGVQHRERECTDPRHGGKHCQGSSKEYKDCKLKKCPVHGAWKNWSQWSSCSVSCGNGVQHRDRDCTDPRHGGKHCQGTSKEYKDCKMNQCPVHGAWKNWSQWSSCSVSCGNGVQHRDRDCTDPRHGGKHCQGPSKEYQDCKMKECVSNVWNPWSQWSACSKTCSSGISTRSRTCNHSPCPPGNNYEKRQCYDRHCPIDGNFSQWSPWSGCSTTCGLGISIRQRKCDQPSPLYGGKYCQGSFKETQKCYLKSCDSPNQWGLWSTWSSCTQSCGKGTIHRNRKCLNGNYCHGKSKEVKDCYGKHCAIEGGWTEWSYWSKCTVQCKKNTGSQARRRWCSNPAPSNGGHDCIGLRKERRFCEGTMDRQTSDPSAPCYYING